MDQQTEALFREILETRSLTVIHYIIELRLPSYPADSILVDMLQSSRLDNIYAMCHDQLGEHDQAKTLRDFMARQDSRTTLHHSPSVIDFVEDADEDNLDTPTEKRYVLLEIFEDDDANDTTFDSYEDALSEEDMMKMLAAKLGYTLVKQTEDRKAGIERAMQLAHQWAWACYTKALDKGGDIDGTRATLLTFLDQEWKCK